MSHRPCRVALAAALLALALAALWAPGVTAQPTLPPGATAQPTLPPTTAQPTLPPTMAQPAPTATAGPSVTPTSTTGELLIRVFLGDDQGGNIVELSRRIGLCLVMLAFAVLIVVPFVWKPVGEWVQKHIKEWFDWFDQKRKDREAQAEHLAALREAISGYITVLKAALATTSIVPIANAPADSRATRAYVPLRVASDGGTGDEPVLAVLGKDKPPDGLLLTGAAGSGKSHTLRYAALALAEAWPKVPADLATDLGLKQDGSYLPIYVRLQDLPRCREEFSKVHPGKEWTVLGLIDHHLCRLSTDGSSIRAGLTSELVAAQNEQCLFLLDGLDEIDDSVLRREFQEKLAVLSRTQQKGSTVSHSYVVSSRPLPDQSLTATGFVERRLLSLQPEQMRRILFLWCSPEPSGSQAVDSGQQVDDLLQRINADRDFAPMATNPLFLTAMARMAVQSVGLPRLRVKKYAAMIDLLLKWRRNQTDERFGMLDSYSGIDWLARFAACMVALGQTELELDQFIHNSYTKALLTSAEATLPDAGELVSLLGSVVRHTGLLSSIDERCYRFTYGFRDYLAAYAHAPFQEMVERLFMLRDDQAWRTVIVFTVGIQAGLQPERAMPLLTQLLADGPADILLAAEALAEVLIDGFVPKLDRLRLEILKQLTDLEVDPQYASSAATLRRQLEQLGIRRVT